MPDPSVRRVLNVWLAFLCRCVLSRADGGPPGSRSKRVGSAPHGDARSPPRPRSTVCSTTRRGRRRNCRRASGGPTTRCTATASRSRPRSGSAYDARLPLLRVPVRRPGAGADQDVGHPPRQHLERRLGRPEPRRARHRPGVVPHDGEPERRAARHAEQRRRATRTSRPTGSGTAPAAATTAGYAVEIRLPLAEHPVQGRRRRCAWASCSGGASAASACRSSWPALEPGTVGVRASTRR